MRGSWRSSWRWVVGALVCLVLGWFAFVREVRVPLLGLVDLGFHELGHLLTYWLPQVVTAAMGSVFQIAVPLGIAVYFLWRGRDVAAGAMCLAWGSSAQDVSVYVADAPYQRLHLIGGEHDWAFVLGHFHALNHAAAIAAWVKGFGLVLVVAGLALCCAWPFTGRQRGPEGPLVELDSTWSVSGSRRGPAPADEPPAPPWGGGC